MNFESIKSILFSDTQLPDIFLCEYMPDAEGDYVKVYLYCLFLSKHHKQIPAADLAKQLKMDLSRVKQALCYWENVGVLIKTESGITFSDLKEKEVHKLYRPKLTSSPEEAKVASERNLKRSQVITAINNTFFQGIMSPGWYMDIDLWFEKYLFEEDVMLSLFKFCYDKNKLSRNYINTIAESWHHKGIRNSFDLDNYFIVYEKCDEIKKKICKKLSIFNRMLTEYEEAYIEKWVGDYGFGFDIIELALKKTTSKTNPNFNYIDKILSEWNKAGFKTVDEVQNHMKAFKQETKKPSPKESSNKFFGEDAKIDLSKFYKNFDSNF
ncbi:MAG: DnaD domain protein [Deltaproteobacteria bacterium]